MLYPPEVVDDFNDSEPLSDEANNEFLKESVKIVKRRKKGGIKACSDGFSGGFVFDADIEVDDSERGEKISADSAVDQLDGLRRFLKQNCTQTSLEEKIMQERHRIWPKGNEGEKLICCTRESIRSDLLDESENEIGLLQEAAHKTDHINLKQTIKVKFDESEQFFDGRSKQIAASANSAHQQLTFSDLNLSRPLLKSISEAGFQCPTPIQTACIPIALAGRDICASSATGTGKTAAFILPILERLLFRPSGRTSVTRVLVLVPTRELAIQVFQVSRRLAKYSGVEICLAAGGLDLKAQEAALRLGLDIVIATPGRLIDHLHNSPNFSLANIEVLVLDEADRMLDEQFADQMKEIIRLCARNRQTLLFSATMTDQVADLANLSLKNPVKLFINENTETAMNLRQEFVRIRQDRENEREAYVAALVTRNFPDRCIVFVRTKKDCERMHILLGLFGVKVGRLHGGRTQVQRVECLHAFKKQHTIEVLCATDLAARGLDIDGVTTVINMHMPNTLQHYIHRVGRTARAGKTGRSISLIGEKDRKLLKEITKVNQNSANSFPLMQRKIEPSVVQAYTKRIGETETSLQKLMEEEQIEKQLLMAEKTIKKAEKQIKSMDAKGIPSAELRNSRRWIGGAGKKLNNNGQRPKQKQQHIRSQGRRREAKKTQQQQKTVSSSRPSSKSTQSPNQKQQKQGKKSSFTAEIANVGERAVKRVRHGPDDIEFKRAKREKQKDRVIQKGTSRKTTFNR